MHKIKDRIKMQIEESITDCNDAERIIQLTEKVPTLKVIISKNFNKKNNLRRNKNKMTEVTTKVGIRRIIEFNIEPEVELPAGW